MFEKLVNIILTETQRKIAKGVNIVIWCFFTLISFNVFVKEMNLKKLIIEENISDFVFTGNFIPFISWFTLILLVYHALKYLLINVIPKTSLLFKAFLKIAIPNDYQVSFLNVFYKRFNSISEHHLSKVLELIHGTSLKELQHSKEDISILLAIVLKLFLLNLITISSFRGIELFSCLVALLLFLGLILLFVIGLSSNTNKIKLHEKMHLT